jgi:TRAP-type C4-dicarboxylate transport system substrate-binding protein
VFLFVALTVACTETAQSGIIILRHEYWGAPNTEFQDAQNWWLDQVEARTNGAVQFERLVGGAAVQAKETLEGVQNGLVDVTLVYTGFFSGQVPLNDVLGTMPAVIDHLWTGDMAYWELTQNSKALTDEWANYNQIPVTLAGGSGYQVISKDPIRSLDDFIGKKVYATGLHQKLFDALGAAPVSMASSEIYGAVQTGVLDAVCNSLPALSGYKVAEVAKYLYEIPLGCKIYHVNMNLDTWDNLPRKVQKTIEDLAPDAIKAYAEIYEIAGEKRAIENFAAAGVETTTASAAEIQRVQEIAASAIWDQALADVEAKGLPARELFDKFVELMNKYRPDYPFN